MLEVASCDSVFINNFQVLSTSAENAVQWDGAGGGERDEAGIQQVKNQGEAGWFEICSALNPSRVIPHCKTALN